MEINMIEQNLLHAIMWYVSGIFSYRIISKMLNYGQAYNMYNEMLVYILYMLRLAYKNHEQSCEYEIEQIRKSGCSEEEISLQIKKNRGFQEMWKSMCIASLINSCPVGLRKILAFSNWDEAMRILKKGEKNVSI